MKRNKFLLAAKSKRSYRIRSFVQIVDNAEQMGALEQQKEHWRLEFQLLKIKFEKMRDDLLKEIESLKEKTNHNSSANEQLEEIISSNNVRNHGRPIDRVERFVFLALQTSQLEGRDDRSQSEPATEREILLKIYFTQKIEDLENKLQVANGKGIAFYNEVRLFHCQRDKKSLVVCFSWPTFINV